MKILLLNDNPVVNKLVTLSAQKTSDELDVVTSLENISQDSYDLLVIDDTLYNDDVLSQIKKKTSYIKSLFICARDTEEVQAFDSILKKPFLPTDLVELFSSISQELDSVDRVMHKEEEPLFIVEDTFTSDDEIEDLEDNFGEDIDLSLEMTESVLDNDEAQKVKELLDETSDELEDLDDELDLSDIDLSLASEEKLTLDDDLDFELEDSLELESEEDIALDNDLDLELEDSLDLESEDDIALDNDLDLELEDSLDLESEDKMEEEIEDEKELDHDDLNIEDQIKTAVSELSEKDLEEEVSEDILLEIAETEINSLDSLNSKDLKLAIGEEIEEENDNEELILEEKNIEETSPSTNGVEALKNLLTALTDKNVAASMKGMKISINITLGENS